MKLELIVIPRIRKLYTVVISSSHTNSRALQTFMAMLRLACKASGGEMKTQVCAVEKVAQQHLEIFSTGLSIHHLTVLLLSY